MYGKDGDKGSVLAAATANLELSQLFLGKRRPKTELLTSKEPTNCDALQVLNIFAPSSTMLLGVKCLTCERKKLFLSSTKFELKGELKVLSTS